MRDEVDRAQQPAAYLAATEGNRIVVVAVENGEHNAVAL